MSVPEQFYSDISTDRDLAERINYWQGIFDTVPVTESAQELRLEAQEDLDDYWPFISEPCEIRGMAKLETWHNGRLDSHLEFIDHETAESFGLVIAKVGALALEKWQVCYGFDKIYSHAVVKTRSHETIFLLPKLASITPHYTIEEAFEFVYQPHELLSLRSAELAEELQDPEFLRLSKEEQRHFIEAELEIVTQLADEWGGVEKPIVIENASRAYVRSYVENHLQFQSVNLNGIVISGKCIGLEVLGRAQLLAGKPIDDVKHLVDTEAGLFLTVIISPETAKSCNLRDLKDIYIPISGHDIGISFLESVDAEQ